MAQVEDGEHILHFTPVRGYITPKPRIILIPDDLPVTQSYVQGTGTEAEALGDNYIKVKGTFRIRKVSDVAKLNPELVVAP